MKHTILFSREGRRGIDVAALLIVESPRTQVVDVLLDLEAAVDRWVEETDIGKRTHRYASEDTNIGDLLSVLEDEDSMLPQYLEKKDIKVLSAESFDVDSIVSYDRVLCKVDLEPE